MVYQDGRQKQQNKNKGVRIRWGSGRGAAGHHMPHPAPSVWWGPEAGVRGQEVEVKGHTRSVRILCFPEVFLWSWFLLQLWRCFCLYEQWRLPRRWSWAPPPQRQRFVPAVSRPSWPCSAPCGPAWSGTDVCQKNGPTLQTAARPRMSWSLRGGEECRCRLRLSTGYKTQAKAV